MDPSHSSLFHRLRTISKHINSTECSASDLEVLQSFLDKLQKQGAKVLLDHDADQDLIETMTCADRLETFLSNTSATSEYLPAISSNSVLSKAQTAMSIFGIAATLKVILDRKKLAVDWQYIRGAVATAFRVRRNSISFFFFLVIDSILSHAFSTQIDNPINLKS